MAQNENQRRHQFKQPQILDMGMFRQATTTRKIGCPAPSWYQICKARAAVLRWANTIDLTAAEPTPPPPASDVIDLTLMPDTQQSSALVPASSEAQPSTEHDAAPLPYEVLTPPGVDASRWWEFSVCAL